MARILGICGSPHRDGNSAFALRHALEQAEGRHETRYLSLADLAVLPCIACGVCAKTGRCPRKDDMNTFYDALRWCDALVLSSPVFMGMVSSQLKALMDRCVLLRPDYNKPYELAGKLGLGIACGWFRNGGQEETLHNIHTFFLQMHMLVLNDGAPYCHAGAAIVGSAADDSLGLETVRASMKHLDGELARRSASA